MSIINDAVDAFFGSAPKNNIAGVRIDAILSERLTLDSEISQYPRENGANFTDGIIPSLPTIDIEGVVTNSNVIFLGGLLTTGKFASTGTSKLIAARKAFEEVHKKRAPISLVTGGVTYTNYGMASCSITHKGSGDDGELSIVARLVSMPTVVLKTTSISVTNKANVGATNGANSRAGGTKADTGQAAGTKVSPKDTPSQSTALSLFKYLKG